MRELISAFYEKYGYAPITKESGVVNPGAKSKASLLDKVKRNIEMGHKNTDFMLGNSPDMARCTIICDSYSSMPQKLLEMKLIFPNLKGYISRCKNGYRGVHININIDGMNTEVQLCTREAFEYGQAAEHIYKKWRSFNPETFSLDDLNKKIKTGEIIPSEIVKNILNDDKLNNEDKKNKILFQMFNEQKNEYQETNDLFKELHSDNQFASNEKAIESILLSFAANQTEEAQINEKLLKKFALNKDGTVNDKKAMKYINKIHKLADKVQNRLISSMEELEKNEVNETFDVDANQLKIINLVLNCYDNEFAKKVNENKSINFDDYMVDNSIRKSTYAKQFSIYCMENEITPKELSVNDLKGFMEEYYNDFEAVDNVVNPDELCNSIREIISTHTKENEENNDFSDINENNKTNNKKNNDDEMEL